MKQVELDDQAHIHIYICSLLERFFLTKVWWIVILKHNLGTEKVWEWNFFSGRVHSICMY